MCACTPHVGGGGLPWLLVLGALYLLLVIGPPTGLEVTKQARLAGQGASPDLAVSASQLTVTTAPAFYWFPGLNSGPHGLQALSTEPLSHPSICVVLRGQVGVSLLWWHQEADVQAL